MGAQKKQPQKTRHTLQFRLIVSYFIIIAIVLLLLNSYPIIASQHIIFQNKQGALMGMASMFSSNLGELNQLDSDNTGKVVEILNRDSGNMILVTDPAGKIIYISPGTESDAELEMLAGQVEIAAGGKDVFICRYWKSVFYSYAIQPVQRHGEIVGVICVCERDEEKGAELAALIHNLRTISWIIVLAAMVGSIVSSYAITRRMDQLLQAVQLMSQGQYSGRLAVKGNDELSVLTQEFNELLEQLNDTDQSKRRFVADASHELKAPLASIRLLADSLLQNLEIDRETRQEFLTDINTEVNRLNRLTEELSLLSQMEGVREASPNLIDVKNSVNEVFRALEPQAQQAQVCLEMVEQDPVHVRVNGDELFYILKNLVENGIKYNASGGFVRVTLQNEGDSAVILVEDDGCGIPEELQPRVFERFFRVDKVRSREAGGTGLGLSIVWDAVTKWNGTICLGSREEGGTWFRVEFNRAEELPPARPV